MNKPTPNFSRFSVCVFEVETQLKHKKYGGLIWRYLDWFIQYDFMLFVTLNCNNNNWAFKISNELLEGFSATVSRNSYGRYDRHGIPKVSSHAY